MSHCDHTTFDETTPLAIGSLAPDFTAPTYQNGSIDKKISLSDFRGKWVLLFFYPLDFTFVCPTELIELGKMQDKFKDNNCEIIGVSIDSVYAHQAWANADEKIKNIKFPIISDLTKAISFDYGVLHEDGMSLRGAFVIDPDGVLQAMTVHNLPVGRNPEELLRVVKAFQTGELCPVSWKKGDETLGKA